MNWRSIRALALKDLKEVRQNKAAWMPAIIVPVIFAVVMPLIFVLLPQLISVADIEREMGDMQVLLEKMPPTLLQIFEGRGLEQAFVIYMTAFMLAPLFLVMPLMFSTIIGAESFVGEKERKTLEVLLYTPISDTDLFLGKLLAAVVPAVGISWLTYLVYIVVVNAASYSLMGGIWFPLTAWWPMVFWLTPAFAVLGISAMVLVSSRVKTFMEAYQLSGSLVVLVLGLFVGQLSGVLFLGFWTVIWIGLVIWLADAVLLMFSIGIFKRSQLIVKLT